MNESNEKNWQEINRDRGSDLVAETILPDGKSKGMEAISRELQKYSRDIANNL